MISKSLERLMSQAVWEKNLRNKQKNQFDWLGPR